MAKSPSGLLRLLSLRCRQHLQLRTSKASGCPKWKGMQESLCICPFLIQFPQAASVARVGDEDSLSGTWGCSLQLLPLSYLKKAEIKVCRRSVRNVQLFSHTSSSDLTSKKKLLRSIYLINVFQQSTCPLGHHSLEAVSGFAVFIIFFPQTSHKVSGNSCWLKRWIRASFSSGYTA